MGCTFALTRPSSASTTVRCTGQCLCTGSLYMRWYASGLHADVRSMLLTIVSIAGWAVTTQTIFTKTLPLTVSKTCDMRRWHQRRRKQRGKGVNAALFPVSPALALLLPPLLFMLLWCTTGVLFCSLSGRESYRIWGTRGTVSYLGFGTQSGQYGKASTHARRCHC